MLEREIKGNYDPSRHGDYLAQLDSMEDRANSRPLPAAYAHLLYTLREHIGLVRASLDRKKAQADRPGPDVKPL